MPTRLAHRIGSAISGRPCCAKPADSTLAGWADSCNPGDSRRAIRRLAAAAADPADELPAQGAIPEGDDWPYEPKWDGFRCLTFRAGPNVKLRVEVRSIVDTLLFLEIVAALRDTAASQCVLDGEIVVASGEGFDFDNLLQRIHPAASRVANVGAEARTLPFSICSWTRRSRHTTSGRSQSGALRWKRLAVSPLFESRHASR